MEADLYGLFYTYPFIASFLAGILTFISPCILPLLPAYLSYISGESLEDLDAGASNKAARLHAVVGSLCFIIGFSLTFILIGSSISALLHYAMGSHIIKVIAGCVIIIFGLHFIFHFKVSALYRSKSVDFAPETRIKKGALKRLLVPFIFGLTFALSWTPCVGPILSSILLLASGGGGGGVWLLTTYCAGLALPFFLTGVFISTMLGLSRALRRYGRAIECIAGALLIIIGASIALDLTSTLSSYLT